MRQRRLTPVAASVIVLGLSAGVGTGVAAPAARTTATPEAVATADPARPLGRTAGRTAPGEWSSTECGTFTGRGCAPTRARVDLVKPTFSNPTKITNPLFPVTTIESVVLSGTTGGKPFRSETTVLPYTTHVVWEGNSVEVVMSQYLASTDGLIEEMALDRYAQADDGSVWYFGEDVFDYVDGTIAVSEGTWLAGRDGPPAMIMPAHPKVGDVFRSENVTGVVFEELKVRSVDRTVAGPNGPVRGAVVMDELHVDGVTLSGKVFAPGYGEFRTTGAGGDLEEVAVASTTDRRSGDAPAALGAIETASFGLLENVRLEDWKPARFAVNRLRDQWKALHGATPPPRLAKAMDKALGHVTAAVKAEDVEAGARSAADVAEVALDLGLLYQPRTRVDIERIHLHAQRLRNAAAARRRTDVNAETAILEWTAARILGQLDPTDRPALEAQVRDVRSATDARNLPGAADHAARLAAWLRGVALPA